MNYCKLQLILFLSHEVSSYLHYKVLYSYPFLGIISILQCYKIDIKELSSRNHLLLKFNLPKTFIFLLKICKNQFIIIIIIQQQKQNLMKNSLCCYVILVTLPCLLDQICHYVQSMNLLLSFILGKHHFKIDSPSDISALATLILSLNILCLSLFVYLKMCQFNICTILGWPYYNWIIFPILQFKLPVQYCESEEGSLMNLIAEILNWPYYNIFELVIDLVRIVAQIVQWGQNASFACQSFCNTISKIAFAASIINIITNIIEFGFREKQQKQQKITKNKYRTDQIEPKSQIEMNRSG